MKSMTSAITELCDLSFSSRPPDWFGLIEGLINICIECQWIWLDHDESTILFCTCDGTRVSFSVPASTARPQSVLRVICARLFDWVTREVNEQRITLVGQIDPWDSNCDLTLFSSDGRNHTIHLDHRNTGTIQWIRFETTVKDL